VLLKSISSTYYKQLLRQHSLAKIFQSQLVRREKLRETLWYKKFARKMLMKLTPGEQAVPGFSVSEPSGDVSKCVQNASDFQVAENKKNWNKFLFRSRFHQSQ